MPPNTTTTAPKVGIMDLLLRSGDALRNWRALLTLVGAGVAALVMMMASAATGHAAVIFVGVLVGYATLSVGISASGILLMDQALNLTPRRIRVALVDGARAAVRLFVILLIGLAGALAAVLVVALLVLICKIPGLGGLLYAVVLPASVLLIAFVYAGLYFVFALAGAAVWSGVTLRQALSALVAIVTHRFVESAIGVLLLSLFMLLVGGVIGVFVSTGIGIVAGLSAGILDTAMIMLDLSTLFEGGRAQAVVYGGMLGLGILVAVVGSVIFSMALLGLNRLYLHLSADLAAPSTTPA
jgi:hypothetical protein